VDKKQSRHPLACRSRGCGADARRRAHLRGSLLPLLPQRPETVHGHAHRPPRRGAPHPLLVGGEGFHSVPAARPGVSPTGRPARRLWRPDRLATQCSRWRSPRVRRRGGIDGPRGIARRDRPVSDVATTHPSRVHISVERREERPNTRPAPTQSAPGREAPPLRPKDTLADRRIARRAKCSGPASPQPPLPVLRSSRPPAGAFAPHHESPGPRLRSPALVDRASLPRGEPRSARSRDTPTPPTPRRALAGPARPSPRAGSPPPPPPAHPSPNGSRTPPQAQAEHCGPRLRQGGAAELGLRALPEDGHLLQQAAVPPGAPASPGHRPVGRPRGAGGPPGAGVGGPPRPRARGALAPPRRRAGRRRPRHHGGRGAGDGRHGGRRQPRRGAPPRPGPLRPRPRPRRGQGPGPPLDPPRGRGPPRGGGRRPDPAPDPPPGDV